MKNGQVKILHAHINDNGGFMKIARLLIISIVLVLFLHSPAMAAPGKPIKIMKNFMDDTWGSQFLKRGADKYFCASKKYKMKTILESKREARKKILKGLKAKYSRKYIKTLHYDISQLNYRVFEETNKRAIIDVSGVINFGDKVNILKRIPLKQRFLLIIEKRKWKICDFQVE